MTDNNVKDTKVSEKKDQQLISLADIKVADIANQNKTKLRKMCKIEGLITIGKKTELVRSLIVKKTGTSDKFAGNMTKCRMCGNRVQVISTDTTTIRDGRTLVTRTVKCKGRRRHTYPLKMVVLSD